MKNLIKNIKKHVNIYQCPKTGIAWIEDNTTGLSYSLHPNIDSTGSISGMKKLGYWNKKDKTIKTNGFIFNISQKYVSNEYNTILQKYCQCEECK